jgi:hypothetical protein
MSGPFPGLIDVTVGAGKATLNEAVVWALYWPQLLPACNHQV